MSYLLDDEGQVKAFRAVLDAFLTENANFMQGTQADGTTGPMYMLCCVSAAPSLAVINRGVGMIELMAIARVLDPDGYDKHMAIHVVDLMRKYDMPNFADQIERQVWQKETLGTMFSGQDNAVS